PKISRSDGHDLNTPAGDLATPGRAVFRNSSPNPPGGDGGRGVPTRKGGERATPSGWRPHPPGCLGVGATSVDFLQVHRKPTAARAAEGTRRRSHHEVITPPHPAPGPRGATRAARPGGGSPGNIASRFTSLPGRRSGLCRLRDLRLLPHRAGG